MKIAICILMIGIISISCMSTRQGNSKPTSPTSSVLVMPTLNVYVSKPNDQEIDQLTTLNKLPSGSCSDTQQGITCVLNANQVIKWGWGFCENDVQTLKSKLSKVEVELLVDGNVVPGAMIYQRDEVYDRIENGYCHVWIVKLSDWRSSATVKLENRASFPSFYLKGKTLLIQVK